jgi:hypothetical protein
VPTPMRTHSPRPIELTTCASTTISVNSWRGVPVTLAQVAIRWTTAFMKAAAEGKSEECVDRQLLTTRGPSVGPGGQEEEEEEKVIIRT